MSRALDAIRRRATGIQDILTDDARRRTLLFRWFGIILAFVSAVMTVVNIFTAKWLLMSATLIFAVFCLLNLLISRLGRLGDLAARAFFLVEAVILCGFFCISGTPEGFSALWTCFIPSFSLALLGRKGGSVYSGVGFLMVAALFWTPFGRSLLHYAYTDSFMLRFPLIYMAFFLLALFLEVIRSVTQAQLIAAEQRYQYLYKHDALTGIFNRHGFNEQLDLIFARSAGSSLSLLILDLDLFKNVNDTYGHSAGDVVLRFTADTIREISGPEAIVCRWGGEEFTVLLPGEEDPEGLAERIRLACETARIPVDGSLVSITVSIGVCLVSDPAQVTIAQAVKAADQCLYAAKDAGRNHVCATRL